MSPASGHAHAGAPHDVAAPDDALASRRVHGRRLLARRFVASRTLSSESPDASAQKYRALSIYSCLRSCGIISLRVGWLDGQARSACSVRDIHLVETISTQPPISLFMDGYELAIQESEHVRRDEGSEQELLNRLAAIQAAAEILDDNEDLSPRERRLFVLVIRTETTRLYSIIAG